MRRYVSLELNIGCPLFCRGNDRRLLTARLNRDDQDALEEETRVTDLMNSVVAEHGSVADIPKSQLYEAGLSRIWNGRKYILFKKLEVGSGAVVIR